MDSIGTGAMVPGTGSAERQRVRVNAPQSPQAPRRSLFSGRHLGPYLPNLPTSSSISSAVVASRKLSSATSGLRSADGTRRLAVHRSSRSLALSAVSRTSTGWRRPGSKVLFFLAGLLFLGLITASLVGWLITYNAGVQSVHTIGERLQEFYPPKVMAEVQLRMEPARVHVLQGLELLHQLGLDPTTWKAYDAIRVHGVSFLLNYFDDAQCCYGLFTHVSYTPGVNEDNLGDDRALFDAVIATRHYDEVSDTTVTTLAELRPGNTSGSATNEAYWVPFNETDRKLPWPLEVSNYQNIGFIHFPRDDGVNPANPKSGWWRVINSRDMQEGEFCFSPIFVWKVNEPVTLKIHALVPVWRQSERVGAYVVGFKLHFLAKYLKETAAEMAGGNTFIVERDTGFIIACDNDTMPLMSESQDTIHTHNVEDDCIRALAHHLAPDGDWNTVPRREHLDAEIGGVPTMIFVDSYEQYCLDWVVVVAVPRQTVLEGISSQRTSTIVASVSAPVAMLIAVVLVICVVPYVVRQMKHRKSQHRPPRGPPSAGEKVSVVVTDIQGSTSLWDRHPEELAKDIAIHHQCLRAELKNFNGYELSTEGDSMRIAFHSPDDAITFCIQVQLNLLCAPWSPALEDGGHALLSGDSSWANPGVPMMEQHHEAIIKDLPFNGAFNSDKDQSPSHVLFDVQLAAQTALSRAACKEAPSLTVHHSSSTLPLPIFRGLRVRMGIHTGVINEGGLNSSMRYSGQMMEVAKAVSDLPCGGQIVMTGETLAEVESMHALLARVSKQCEGWRSGLEGSNPDSSQEPEEAAMSVMHLGSHVLLKANNPKSSSTTESPRSLDLEARLQSMWESEISTVKERRDSGCSQRSADAVEAMLQNLRDAHDVLMVVPWPLRARAMYYPPIKSVMEVTNPWHGSPGPNNVTILFTFIENWTLLKRWERETPGAHGTVAHSLDLHDSMVRALLLEHSGYEVEGEDGCFVCAFQLAIDAIEFSVALQEAALQASWDPMLLTTPWACEQMTASGQLLHRGLRVAVGMCTGKARRYQPSLRTGRMEYFGPLMNHAARVAVAAHGGQVLVHSNSLSSVIDANPQMLDLITANIHSMGMHKLKGIASSVEIFQVCPTVLSGRVFPPIKTNTTKLLQHDENADSIFLYGLDHTCLPYPKVTSPGSVDSSGSLQEYERYAQKLMKGSSGAAHSTDSLGTLRNSLH